MEPERTNGLGDDELADLTCLADGALPDDRRAEVEARVAASPQLSSIVEPRVSHWKRCEARPTSAHRRGCARLSTGAAARAARLGVGVGESSSGSRSMPLRPWHRPDPRAPERILGWPQRRRRRVARRKPPTQPAPGGVPGAPALLRAEVDNEPFPNYAAKFGWLPVGARQDDPSGGDATIVHYEKGGRTVAYTTVSGDALDPPSDAPSTTRDGVEYRSFRDDGRTVVTWERDGHTCVLSAKAVRPADLLTLADWRGKGALAF